MVALYGRRRAGVTIIVLAVTLPIVQALIVFGVLDARAFRIPSQTMEPTLEIGDRIVTTDASELKPGDIVVFHPPAGADEGRCGVPPAPDRSCEKPTRERSDVTYVQRVVAVGGDRVAVVGGRAVVNGERRREPYIRADAACPPCNLPQEVVVPEGHYFILGDNRGESSDSRFWGPVPEDWIVGKARLRYWPTSRFGSP